MLSTTVPSYESLYLIIGKLWPPTSVSTSAQIPLAVRFANRRPVLPPPPATKPSAALPDPDALLLSARSLSLTRSLPPSLPPRDAPQATAWDDLDGGPPSARRRPPSSFSSSSSSTTTTPLPPHDATRRVARPRVSPLRRRSYPRPRGQPSEALTRRRPLAADEPPWWPCMTTGRSRQQNRRWIWSGRSRGPSRRPI